MMHGKPSETTLSSGPETTGATLHHATQYDLHTRWMGLGVNGRNSRMVVEMAQIKPGESVLDVGCGTGSLTLTAKRYVGPTGAVMGIDASPEMIVEAQKKAQHGEVVFEVGLVEKMAYPAATYDVVINRLVIHHLPDDLKRRAFAEVLRVLKPGGRFFIADFKLPANPFLAHIARALFGHRMMQASRLDDIPPMLKEAGFIEVTSGPTRSPFMAFVSGKKPAA